MDKCQPISVELKNKKKVFILLIEDENLKKNNDPEHFYCVSPHYPIPLNFFRTAADAIEDAFKRVKEESPILRVLDTMGFERFFTEDELSKKI